MTLRSVGKFALLGILGVSLALTPNVSWAQGRVRIGYYGGGGYGYGRPGVYIGVGPGYYGGYRRGYYGGGYYPGNYGYGTPVYNYAPAVTTNVVPNASVYVGNGQPVVIENLKGNGSAVNYKLNGYAYTIQPGETQRLTNDRRWVVEFDRGAGFGSARYTLSDGRFKFKPTDRGWELVRAASLASAEPPPAPMPQ